MLSRVADCLFWLGRYIERAENYARFIDVNYNLSIDLPPEMREQWPPLIAATGDMELFEELNGTDYSRNTVIFFLAFDENNPNAIISTVRLARENARIIRESIPRESWEVLNELHYYIRDIVKEKAWENENPMHFLGHIKGLIQQLNGIGYDNIPRNHGWYFAKMGQHLERADMSSRILDVKYHILLPSVQEIGTPLDYLHWNALLKSVSAFNSYRQIYHSIEPLKIVEYLILDRQFPRSIFYCLNIVEKCLHDISESKHGFSNKAEKAIGNLRSRLEYAEVQDIFDEGLHEYLDALQVSLNNISEAVYNQYFKIQPNYNIEDQQQSQS
jgi:uncharacterized alpha-E superfamily protein